MYGLSGLCVCSQSSLCAFGTGAAGVMKGFGGHVLWWVGFLGVGVCGIEWWQGCGFVLLSCDGGFGGFVEIAGVRNGVGWWISYPVVCMEKVFRRERSV